MNKNKLTSIIYYFSILIFIIAFNFSDHGSGGWTQQFMPDLNNRPLVDITFTDSLTGYAILSSASFDTSFVLKTTNGGDNWNVMLSENRVEYKRIIFLNNAIGYVGGATLNGGGSTYMLKTLNGGYNWTRLTTPNSTRVNDMAILSEDTIWIVDASGFDGGIYRTTNGGMNWTFQYQHNSNLEKIYIYNRNVGFASSQSYLFRTINSGINWNIIDGQNGYRDIFFIDSLTGWKANIQINDSSFNKTTDGGLNWFIQKMPSGSFVTTASGIAQFTNINSDTIWGGGGALRYPNNNLRGILYYSSNGGSNWYYQIPDTSFRIPVYQKINFANRLNGWGYSQFFDFQLNESVIEGIHSIFGGDTTFTKIGNQNLIFNKNFILYQNFPNPFNPITKISYELKQNGRVTIKVFDILGNELETLVKANSPTGSYDVEFDGSAYSSGIYFYRMEINSGKETFMDSKKMILIK